MEYFPLRNITRSYVPCRMSYDMSHVEEDAYTQSDADDFLDVEAGNYLP